MSQLAPHLRHGISASILSTAIQRQWTLFISFVRVNIHNAIELEYRSTQLHFALPITLWIGTARKKQWEAAVESVRALDVTFTAYWDDLEQVDVFKYLGCLMAMNDNAIQAVPSNLQKARKIRAHLSRLLCTDNATPRASGMFSKATIQAVLLFGSATWNLTPSVLKLLRGFHVQAAWRMVRLFWTRSLRAGTTLPPRTCLRKLACLASNTISRFGARLLQTTLYTGQSFLCVRERKGFKVPALASFSGNNLWTWSWQGHLLRWTMM